MLLVVFILLGQFAMCQAGIVPAIEHKTTRRRRLALQLLTTAAQICRTTCLAFEAAIQTGMSCSQRCMLHGMARHYA